MGIRVRLGVRDFSRKGYFGDGCYIPEEVYFPDPERTTLLWGDRETTMLFDCFCGCCIAAWHRFNMFILLKMESCAYRGIILITMYSTTGRE